MTAKKQHASRTSQQPNPPAIIPNPPQASRWQLILSSFFLTVWLIFLAWMAFFS
ncbi:hypothetical protein Pla144_00850 [Bythopirellula polymerisocia]|uniref:Uncharacterized protein n=1 Tax=Bythopirellula polymerisocia TaxID=2528003 RepID=A0A5C6D377_9BACT|nr:hypothetical protein Pla144_00850 [Bythopirellula polymerisocia]